MRSTENVRGEWDELGERDTRVIVPGPGTGDVPGPAETEHGARLPEPGAEPDPVAESTAGVPDTMPVAGEPPAAEDEYIPADLGPALDAVAVVGPAAPVELDLDLGAGPEPGPHGPAPDPEPVPEPVLPGAARAPASPVAEPARDEPSGAVPDTAREAEPWNAAPVAPAPRKTVPGAPRPADDQGRAPVALTVGAADPVAWWGAGRRQPVIATETTATIPVHLLFRDDGPGATAAGPGGASAGATAGTGGRRTGDRRPPVPRSPQVQAPTRPSPLADPRLVERPGPALPGWAALFTAATGVAAGLAVLWWQGALPAAVTGRIGLAARPDHGIGALAWALLGLLVAVVLFTCCGLGRGRAGHASVLTLFGGYRGSVRRTGLLWISPLLRRRRIDVRLRHWRSEPLPAVDAGGTALRVEVLVVWRVKDTARAALGVADHERYLRDQVEAALARVLSQLPADAFHEDTHTLRDAEAVGDALTRMLKADCAPVGVEVYSAQPTGIEYAPEVAAAMQRCRVAAVDARHRDAVLTSVVDAVDDTVGRLTARGIVELDAYEHKALVRDLTVAFYTGRSAGDGV
ncbi:SPFH domain-containing protein [Streptomyces sp. KA12]|uniref:SPFH domain-containing protein n=1 Tax=Streptomyces sp. KA12 TaxID=2991730 RepID=UPI0023B10A7E|nr:SPFH domain-containing protein [Streptomyces sp. KA12]MDF0372112.1 SPFH domain-containing protein [Streptomyces sp. KA12]